ncbi:bifunctional phosphopantothenoylcysteine decarboxylase/phosphopantothenate--cysteine ligase CoaBC [Acetobacterium woodii]|uniref:Coenzyme A biosynthesis bifunctional protein CoaBC n=1 Tax=Acetobacterium woodii (strain ATCC 29683 / DSM 1030 / JCM 2381 / KCTC 1655 / WB1) TaxID=931626 RepID=H6LF70_ACEWD|nr:bifunctional phosphopantothenoylcysteine decarboxylase/phosphopantothenate--cysteine ligase CoaBC [Acetobacterium woodii]AFA48170.1 phosphopantothenoylcysteine synthase/decarboxylase CoaBC1 [Acetobacterium woodii DSM 1030]
MKNLLKNKTVVLGITGSIAAYKMANVASSLAKMGCDVQVIMTKNAQEFISPLVFESLTGNKCIVDTFDRNIRYDVAHISLAKKADLFMVAPASANIIGKINAGIADDMLTTTIMACRCPKLIAPAMNTAMYENPIVQNNLSQLKKLGYLIIDPASGILACKDTGIGKLPDEELLIDHILQNIAYYHDLVGKNILVTAGPTCEAVDPVRYLTNHSSGKMGYALARAAMLRGADVTLISGKTALTPPPFVKFIPVVSASEMCAEVVDHFEKTDIVIKAAAVADFKPQTIATEKIKKRDGQTEIRLTPTIDILKTIGEKKRSDQFICGFSMETENMIENTTEKLRRKNVNMMIANNLKEKGAGFNTATNRVTIITPEKTESLPLLSKDDVAHRVLDAILDTL